MSRITARVETDENKVLIVITDKGERIEVLEMDSQAAMGLAQRILNAAYQVRN